MNFNEIYYYNGIERKTFLPLLAIGLHATVANQPVQRTSSRYTMAKDEHSRWRWCIISKHFSCQSIFTFLIWIYVMWKKGRSLIKRINNCRANLSRMGMEMNGSAAPRFETIMTIATVPGCRASSLVTLGLCRRMLYHGSEVPSFGEETKSNYRIVLHPYRLCARRA